MPVARADRLDGPWEVNQDVSRGEDFGLRVGFRVASRQQPFRISEPDNSRVGRCAIHLSFSQITITTNLADEAGRETDPRLKMRLN